jgi:hypothetical protein
MRRFISSAFHAFLLISPASEAPERGKPTSLGEMKMRLPCQNTTESDEGDSTTSNRNSRRGSLEALDEPLDIPAVFARLRLAADCVARQSRPPQNY